MCGKKSFLVLKEFSRESLYSCVKLFHSWNQILKRVIFSLLKKIYINSQGNLYLRVKKFQEIFFFHVLNRAIQCFFYFSCMKLNDKRFFVYIFFMHESGFFFFFVWNKVKNKLYCSRPCQRGYCITVLWQHLCSVMMSCNIWDHRESGKQDSRRTALPNCEDIFSMIAFL